MFHISNITLDAFMVYGFHQGKKYGHSLPLIRFGGILSQPITCQLNRLSTCII